VEGAYQICCIFFYFKILLTTKRNQLPHRRRHPGIELRLDGHNVNHRTVAMMQNIKNTPRWACFSCSVISLYPTVPDVQNMPTRACFACSSSPQPLLICRTPQTHPCGHVLGVQHSSVITLTTNMRNMPLWACFLCSW